MASTNFGNALIRKKTPFAHVLGILPSAYVRWFEVDENGWHCESRSVWLSHKRQVHLLNLVVAIFEEQLPMLKCSYVASSLFFVIFSPFEFMQNLTNSKLSFAIKISSWVQHLNETVEMYFINSKFQETVKLVLWILNFMERWNWFDEFWISWNGEINLMNSSVYKTVKINLMNSQFYERLKLN